MNGRGRVGTKGLGRGGNERTKPNTLCTKLVNGVTAGSDEVNSHGVGTGMAVRFSAVEVGGWLGEEGEEIGITSGRACKVFQNVGVGGEEPQPALDAGAVFANLHDTLERFVVGVDSELGERRWPGRHLMAPNDAVTVRLLLLEFGA